MNTCTRCGLEMEQELVDGICPVCVAKATQTQSVVPMESTPHVSRLAIAGACWAALAAFNYLLTLVLVVLMMKYKLFATNAAIPLWAYPLLFLFVVLSPFETFAPLGVTILGWVSASKIRSSDGKLRGLWWAVFDCLWFPLIVLGGVIALGGAALVTEMIPGYKDTLGRSVALASCFCVLAALIDYFIIRRVWRVMKTPKRSKTDISGDIPKLVILGKKDKKAVLLATILHAVLLLVLVLSAFATVVGMKP